MKYRGSNISISPNSVPSTRQLLAGSFHESLRITEIAVKALLLTSGILLYCSAKLALKFLSMHKNFNVLGEINPAPTSFNNRSNSSANVSTFNSSSNPALCQIYEEQFFPSILQIEKVSVFKLRGRRILLCTSRSFGCASMCGKQYLK